MQIELRKLNIGIIGLGKMGLLHAGILNSLDMTNLVAITEKEKLIARYVSASLPDIKVYDNYQQMFESENLDVVYITTPIASHFPITLMSIKEGISFFVEKPLTLDLNQSRTLCQEMRSKGNSLTNMVGYNRRFISTFAKAKALLDQNILGEVSYVKSSMYVSNILSRPTGWRSKKKISGGGVLLDLGAHVIDLLLWYFSSINEVSGNISSVYSKEVEDSAEMKLGFEGGIQGEMKTSWSVQGYRVPELNLEISGERGKMQINEDFIRLEMKTPINDVEELSVDKGLDTSGRQLVIYKQELSNGVPIDLGGPEYTKEDIHMVESTLHKRDSSINILEASKTQSVIQAMYQGAAADADEGKRVVRVEYIV